MMVQRLFAVLLVMMVILAGCKDGSGKPKESVQPPVSVKNVKEDVVEEKPFISIDPEGEKIVWNKDAVEMVRIPGIFKVVPSRTEPAVYDKFGDLVKAETVIPAKKVKVGDAFFMDVAVHRTKSF